MSEYKYKSPIEIIQGEMEVYIEGEIVKAIQKVGIEVDKDELLKALAYDRDQYNKGYHDAEPKVGEWIDKTEEKGWPIAECSVCGSRQGMFWMNFCPNCGAKMERRTEDERQRL